MADDARIVPPSNERSSCGFASTALALGLALSALWATPAAATSFGLFGTVEFRAASHAALPQWRRVLDSWREEQATYSACAADADACPTRGVMAWQQLVKSLQGASEEDQIRAVNRFVNKWKYKPDDVNFGRSDYWATPLEFLRRSGDCEDYAITKYVTLRQLGVPAERMRMVVVQDVLRDIAHAVLAVRTNEDRVVILDNLTNAVLPQTRVSQYVPYYSVNETARWAHVPTIDTRVAAAGGDQAPSLR